MSKVSATVLLFAHGTLHTQQRVEDVEAFVLRVYKAMCYPAPEEVTSTFMAELHDGCCPVIENPAKGTRFEFLTH